MELSGRPLFDNALDAELFVPRPEADRLAQNSDQGINTLVLGEPGSGKTSLLRNVLFQLREQERHALWVDGAHAETVADLLVLIEDGLLGLRGGVMNRNPMVPVLGESARVVAALRQLGSRLEGKERFVVFVDLVPGGIDPYSLFGRYRDELWQIPLTWVVAAPPAMRAALTTPPADVFFEDVVELEPLTPGQQQDLIGRRLGPDEMTPWRLPDEGEGNPRHLLQLVRESFRTGEPVDAHLLARSIRAGELAALGNSAKVAYDYLEENGPTSASDADLLFHLGWSRQRAAKVLSQLENAGLVRSETRQNESGRPRKLFAVVPPAP
jgi:hypothetical protein